jgi:hypothetical protein
VRHALFTGLSVMLFCSVLATPLEAATVPPRPPAPRPSARPTLPPALDGASLYARRSRRLVQSYLRLKLWQLREQDLERARLVIERKLGIGALLGETPPPNAR